MHYLTLQHLLFLHQRIIEQSGGSSGLRDLAGVESALAQPLMTFDGEELYPTLIEKAATLGFSLIMNHPFIDGNKRIGHAGMETLLLLNGFEIKATVEEQEDLILRLAAGSVTRSEWLAWLRTHVVTRSKFTIS